MSPISPGFLRRGSASVAAAGSPLSTANADYESDYRHALQLSDALRRQLANKEVTARAERTRLSAEIARLSEEAARLREELAARDDDDDRLAAELALRDAERAHGKKGELPARM